MKRISKLYLKIATALVVGFVIAAVGTKITYTCTPVDGAAGCVSYDKAVMHLSDLASNKQNSLVHFSTTFIAASLIIFVLLSILNFTQKKV